MPPEGQVNLSPKGVCNVVNRQLAEAGPRQLSQQVVRHPPPVLSELGCLALCFMDIASRVAGGGRTLRLPQNRT